MVSMAEKTVADERGRIAFWSYDLFPFVLGGEGEFDADGNFRASSYGRTFRRESIIAVLPLDKGAEVLELLEVLRADYREKSEQLLDRMMESAYGALPELKEHRKSKGWKP
jgi:hypothetical protein